jgi:hypothetical protein
VGLRRALLHDGARLLEELLAAAIRGSDQATAPQPGEKVYHGRPRTVKTVLGPVRLERAYFYCAARQEGRAPADEALGLLEGYSPGLAKLMCRIAAQQSYAWAAADLLAYGGIAVEGRDIQRMANRMGPPMHATRAAQPEPAPPQPIAVLYVEADGTGIPMIPALLEGKKGRQPDGSARTREVKLGCVFTQQCVDEAGEPIREPDSTTYLGTLEPAAAFGIQLRHEAIRRGMGDAARVVLLGDGAAWVWEQARLNFPQAICILDFYHALEHLRALCSALDGAGPPAERRLDRWAKLMKEGAISRLLKQSEKIAAKGKAAQPANVTPEVEYFRKNEARMHYDQYRRAGLFLGSGVVEAGCRNVIGQRLKKSGMFWSEAGAQSVVDLRCALLGGHFDEDWARLFTQKAA